MPDVEGAALLPVKNQQAVRDLTLPIDVLPEEMRELGLRNDALGIRAEPLPGTEVLVVGPEGDPLVVKMRYGLVEPLFLYY